MKPCFLALAILAILGSQSAYADIVLGPTMNPDNGLFYYLLSPNTWANAQAEARSLGGDLASITNPSEQAWLLNFVNNHPDIQAGAQQVWTGLNRTQGTDWQWVAGAPLTYTNWASGEPNNVLGNEFFGSFYSGDNQWGLSGQWNDAPNSMVLYSVAQVSAVPEPSSLLLLSIGAGGLAFYRRKSTGSETVSGPGQASLMGRGLG